MEIILNDYHKKVNSPIDKAKLTSKIHVIWEKTVGGRLKNAKLDDIVESCYPGYPFASDEARLECLFKLYEKMTAGK